jgi:hypothetical protein
MPARDLSFFRWRYGPDSPHARRQVAVATGADGELRGYVVFYLAGDPYRSGYVLDLQALAGDEVQEPLSTPGSAGGGPDAAAREAGLDQGGQRVAGALLAHAVRRLRRQGAWTVRYHCLAPPDAPSPAWLRRLGFRQRGGHRFLVRFRDGGLAEVADRLDAWNFAHGDSEASHALV